MSDHLTATPGALAVQALSIVVGVAGVAVMGRRLRTMHLHHVHLHNTRHHKNGLRPAAQDVVGTAAR
jgi:hypothetical protein